jgi:hypothetical protein
MALGWSYCSTFASYWSYIFMSSTGKLAFTTGPHTVLGIKCSTIEGTFVNTSWKRHRRTNFCELQSKLLANSVSYRPTWFEPVF